jgi:hypothetical protein
MPKTVFEPCPASVTPSPQRNWAASARPYMRAARRMSSGSTPEISARPLRGAAGQPPPDLLEPGGMALDEGLVDEPFLNQNVLHGVHHRHVRSGPQREVEIGQLGQLGVARVEDDEPAPLKYRLLDPGSEDRMGLGRIRPHQHDQIRVERRLRRGSCPRRFRAPAPARTPRGSGRRGSSCRWSSCPSPRARTSASGSSPRSCSATS